MDKRYTVYYRMLLIMGEKYMNTKNTTAQNLQKAIKDHLVTVVNAQTECKDTDEVQTITAETKIPSIYSSFSPTNPCIILSTSNT